MRFGDPFVSKNPRGFIIIIIVIYIISFYLSRHKI